MDSFINSSSEDKFDAGNGWPAFYFPIQPDAIKEELDTRIYIVKIEAKCSKVTLLNIKFIN